MEIKVKFSHNAFEGTLKSFQMWVKDLHQVASNIDPALVNKIANLINFDFARETFNYKYGLENSHVFVSKEAKDIGEGIQSILSKIDVTDDNNHFYEASMKFMHGCFKSQFSNKPITVTTYDPY